MAQVGEIKTKLARVVRKTTYNDRFGVPLPYIKFVPGESGARYVGRRRKGK